MESGIKRKGDHESGADGPVKHPRSSEEGCDSINVTLPSLQEAQDMQRNKTISVMESHVKELERISNMKEEKIIRLQEAEERMGRWLYEPLRTSRWVAGIAWLEVVELEGSIIMKRYFAESVTDEEACIVFSRDLDGFVENLNFLHAIRVGERQHITPILRKALSSVEEQLANLWPGVTQCEVHQLFTELLEMKKERNEVAHGFHIYDWKPTLVGFLPFPPSAEAASFRRLNVVRTIPQKKTSVSLPMVRAHLDVCEDLLRWAATTLPGFFSSPCYQAALKWYGSSLYELVRTCMTTEGCSVYGQDKKTDRRKRFYYVNRITGVQRPQVVVVNRMTGQWLEKDEKGRWRLLDKCLASS